MAQIRLKGNAVNEQSICYIRATYEDREGVPTTPLSLRYRIDCLTNQAAVLDWTDIEPQAVNEVVITSAQNRILNTSNVEEVRQVTVEATGADGPVIETETYRVRNLLGVT